MNQSNPNVPNVSKTVCFVDRETELSDLFKFAFAGTTSGIMRECVSFDLDLETWGS